MAVESDPSNRLEFAGFALDLHARRVYQEGRDIGLTDRPLDVLAQLAKNPGQLITKTALQRAVWGDVNVTANTVERTVAELRAALGDSRRQPKFIKTVHGRGYVFIGEPVRNLEGSQEKSDLRRAVWVLAAFGAVAFVVAGVALTIFPTSNHERTNPEVLSIRRITSSPTEKFTHIATDGSTVYFTEFVEGRYRVSQVPITGGQITPLRFQLTNPYLVGISHDFSSLLVRTVRQRWLEDAPLWLVPLDGGPPERFGDLEAYDGSWSQDGERVAITPGKQLVLTANDGSRPENIATLDGGPWWPRWSPEGDRIRFSLFDLGANLNSLWEIKPDGSDLHRLLANWGADSVCCGNWTADGGYFVLQSSEGGSDQIWMVRENDLADSPENTKPLQLTRGPMSFRQPTVVPGRRTILARGIDYRAEILEYRQDSESFIPLLPNISAESVAFSPDGSQIAYVTLPDYALCTRSSEGGEAVQLTTPPLRVGIFEWSPDGRRIAFMGRNRREPWRLFAASADGGKVEPILLERRHQADPTWAPDGSSLVFGGVPVLGTEDSAIEIRRVNLDSGGVYVLPGSSGLFSPRWSPDGQYIAAIRADNSQALLFDWNTEKWSVLADLWAGYPSWSRDSEYLYFLNREADKRAMYRVHVADRTLEKVVDLTEVEPAPTTFGWWIGLGRGGAPLVTRNLSTEEIYAIDWDEKSRLFEHHGVE